MKNQMTEIWYLDLSILELFLKLKWKAKTILINNLDSFWFFFRDFSWNVMFVVWFLFFFIFSVSVSVCFFSRISLMLPFFGWLFRTGSQCAMENEKMIISISLAKRKIMFFSNDRSSCVLKYTKCYYRFVFFFRSHPFPLLFLSSISTIRSSDTHMCVLNFLFSFILSFCVVVP